MGARNHLSLFQTSSLDIVGYLGSISFETEEAMYMDSESQGELGFCFETGHLGSSAPARKDTTAMAPA